MGTSLPREFLTRPLRRTVDGPAHGLCALGRKDHGRQNRSRANWPPGQGGGGGGLISTGGAVIEVVRVLREAGARGAGRCEYFYLWHETGLDALRDEGVRERSLNGF